jgi:hypothetical protein
MVTTLNNFDGTPAGISIPDGGIDNSTSLKFPGNGYLNYGLPVTEDLLWLMQSFANNTAPPTPIKGQIWYDTGNQALKVYDGSGWLVIGPISVGTSPPNSPATGELWYDTRVSVLKTYTGNNGWAAIGPGTSPTSQPTSPLVGQTYYNVTDQYLRVYTGTVWEIVGPQAANTLVTSSLTAPANPVVGQLWYDETNNQLKAWVTSPSAEWLIIGPISAETGAVTSVAQTFADGLLAVTGSPITTAGTLAVTISGNSGGIPYFNSNSTWTSSPALTANQLVVGGGTGQPPVTVTTNSNFITAVAYAPTGTGPLVLSNGPTLSNALLNTPNLGTPSAGILTNATGLPLTRGVVGVLPAGNGGTGLSTTGTLNQLLTSNGSGGWQTSSLATLMSSIPTLSIKTVIFIYTGSTQYWTCPVNVTQVRVTVVGGGGGGFSYGGGCCTTVYLSGGNGGVAIGLCTVTPGQTYSITIGAGGDAASSGLTSSFGSFLTATGGTGAAGTANGTDGAGYSGTGATLLRSSSAGYGTGTILSGAIGSESTTTAKSFWVTTSSTGAGNGCQKSVFGGNSGAALIEYVG